MQLARHIATSEHAEAFIRGVVIAKGPKAGPEAEAFRQKFLADYRDSVIDIQVRGPPPIRGPFGEAQGIIKNRSGGLFEKKRLKTRFLFKIKFSFKWKMIVSSRPPAFF